MTLKGIVCDFGGVLILSGSNETRQYWANRFHMPIPQFMDELFQSQIALKSLRGDASEDEMWQEIQSKFKLEDAELERLHHDVFHDDILNLELINRIKSLPHTMKKAILSNAWLGARRIFTQKYQLDHVFDLMVISAEEGLIKPEEEIYIRTAHRLGLKPWELLFIDDMMTNVMAATKVGMAAIHFKNTASTIEQVNTILKSQGVI